MTNFSSRLQLLDSPTAQNLHHWRLWPSSTGDFIRNCNEWYIDVCRAENISFMCAALQFVSFFQWMNCLTGDRPAFRSKQETYRLSVCALIEMINHKSPCSTWRELELRAPSYNVSLTLREFTDSHKFRGKRFSERHLIQLAWYRDEHIW